MRPRIALLAAVLVIAVMLAGCQKPAEPGTGPTPPPVAKATSAKAPAQPAAAEKVVLTTPDGESLVLIAGTPDEKFLTDLGLTPYPKSKALTLDVDGTIDASIEAEKKKSPEGKMTESQEKSGREFAKAVFSGRNAFYETEDSLDDAHKWASANLKGWTIGAIEEKDGVKSFEIAKEELKEKVACAFLEVGGKRYMMVIEAPSDEAMNQAMGPMGEAMGKAMSEGMSQAGGAAKKSEGEAAKAAGEAGKKAGQ